MDGSRHVKMDEANELEIAGLRELHVIRFWADDRVKRPHHARIHALGTIEAGAIGRDPGAAYLDPKYLTE